MCVLTKSNCLQVETDTTCAFICRLIIMGQENWNKMLLFLDSVVGIIGIKLKMHLLILNQFSRQMKYIRGWHDRLTLTEK